MEKPGIIEPAIEKIRQTTSSLRGLFSTFSGVELDPLAVELKNVEMGGAMRKQFSPLGLRLIDAYYEGDPVVFSSED